MSDPISDIPIKVNKHFFSSFYVQDLVIIHFSDAFLIPKSLSIIK